MQQIKSRSASNQADARVVAAAREDEGPHGLKEMLAAGTFDFLDFGCSKGASLRFGMRKLRGKRGLGIDIAASKVKKTRQAGFQACQADIRELNAHPDCVDFVVMSHFLEHLPSLRDAEACIRVACTAARRFVFIRQPWFDSDGYLFAKKLKLYWSDWVGHPNAMTSLELYRCLSQVEKASHIRIYGKDRIRCSHDPAVIPLSAPSDSFEWDPGQHGKRSMMDFETPVYREVAAFVAFGDTKLDDIQNRVDNLEKIFDSEDLTHE